MSRRKEGKLIVFEGVEKSGKSTQIKLLFERLERAGVNVVLSKEPSGKFREELLHGNPLPSRELDLFLENRMEHFAEIIPDLKKGRWRLVDRSSPSTIAYQHFGRGIERKEIERRDKIARQGRKFDLIILIDMDPVEAFKRAAPENRFEKENLEFHRRVRRGYQVQSREDRKRWLVIDGNKREDETEELIWKEVQKRFLKE